MIDPSTQARLTWHSTSPYLYVEVSGRLKAVSHELVGIGNELISRSRLSLASELIVMSLEIGEDVIVKVKRA